MSTARSIFARVRFAFGLALGAVAIGLLFVSTYFGSVVCCIWLFVCGRWVLKAQSQPFGLPVRIACVAGILLTTAFVTLIPWLFYGGKEGCSEFDTSMKTSYGRTFNDFWIQLYFRGTLNWLAAIIASYMVLADHPASAYIRQSVRCVLFLWQSRALGSIGTLLLCRTMIEACEGADYDNDGQRDFASTHSLPAKLITPYGYAAGFIGDIWCLQLVIERLLAMEEAFGETLPRSRVIVWLSRFLIVWIALLAGTVYISRFTSMLVSMGVALGLAAITALVWLAYSVPLAALQAVRKVDAEDEATGLFQTEAAFAARVIRSAQVGMVLASTSMAWHFAAYGVSWVVNTKEWSDAYQYGLLADSLGNLMCLFLLAASAMRLPRVHCRSRIPQEVEELRQEEACTCGRQVGKALSGSPNRRPSHDQPDIEMCYRCAWDEKVAELANRQISVADLLTFYIRLGRSEDNEHRLKPLMPHFDAGRSTTNDVVRHAIIPESRDGDLGLALADILARKKSPGDYGSGDYGVGPVTTLTSAGGALTSSHPPRMVTHHWGNCFRDLVAAVVADGLSLRRWDLVAEQLSTGHEEELRVRLHDCGALHWHYWICAICINQHASICGSSMGVRDTVTGDVLPCCDCRTPKYFNDCPILCELNKFDSMMASLHHSHPNGFLQVVAIDKKFQLFSRAWCVAELVEAYNSHLEQHVMLHSPEVLEQHSRELCSLHVEDCSASRAEDKEAILAKIGEEAEIATFNARLQSLLLGSEGLLAGWLDGQKILQEVGAIAARAKARSRIQESGEVLTI